MPNVLVPNILPPNVLVPNMLQSRDQRERFARFMEASWK